MNAADRDAKIADAKINQPHKSFASYDPATGKTKIVNVRHKGDGQLRKVVVDGLVSEQDQQG